MKVKGQAGNEKLAVLHPHEHVGSMPNSATLLLSFPVIGVACSCKTTCSSSSSPTAVDEPSDDWDPPENLVESPTAAAQSPRYCCLGGRSSNCYPNTSANEDYSWWSSCNENKDSSSGNKDVDSSENSTVPNLPSRPKGTLDLPSSPTSQGTDCSSRSSGSRNNTNATSNSGNQESESITVLLRSVVSRGNSLAYCDPASTSSSSSCCCSGGNNAVDSLCPAAADCRQQQQGTGAAGPVTGLSNTAAQEAHRWTSLSTGSLHSVPQRGQKNPPGKPPEKRLSSDTHETPPPPAATTGVSRATHAAAEVQQLMSAEENESPTSQQILTQTISSGGDPQQQLIRSSSSNNNEEAAAPAAAAGPTAASPWPATNASLPVRGPPHAGPPSGEPRLCYCLEHLLAGLWGPRCLCGPSPPSSLLGGGPLAADGHLVNPQHELEVLLQGAPDAANASDESILSIVKLATAANEDKRKEETNCENLWSPLFLGLGPPGEPLQGAVGPPFPVPSYPAIPCAEAWAPTSFFWGSPRSEASSPVGDWGSPAQQWGPPSQRWYASRALSSKQDEEEEASPKSHLMKHGAGKAACCRKDDEAKELRKHFLPLEVLGAFPEGQGPTHRARCPRTPLSADSFVSSPALWYSSLSSEDEGEESACEEGEALPPLSACSPICGQRHSTENGTSPFSDEGSWSSKTREGNGGRRADGHRGIRNRLHPLLPASRRTTAAPFALRPSPSQHMLLSPSVSHSGNPLCASLDIWEDGGEAGRPRKVIGGGSGGGPTGYVGGRWRDTLREDTRLATCSNSPHQPLLGIAAVPVRTRKGFRKPLPLPPEMLAAIAAAGPRGPIEPVLQYDGESREWRVFWMEEPQARYKVFQSKKFGKERAQQLALEWLRRAKSGAIHVSGRGPRSAGAPGYRAKRSRLEATTLATEYKHSSSEMKQLSTPHSSLHLSPASSPTLAPFPNALPEM